MKAIEVTKETFYKIYDGSFFSDKEDYQKYSRETYYNKKLEQNGIIIHNFIGNITQYYLADINS
tara:strand:+ start:84 stop:275 length:192 start_codon:yes stop_codon:yes gene_type:complete